jgi:hypothetical protein
MIIDESYAPYLPTDDPCLIGEYTHSLHGQYILQDSVTGTRCAYLHAAHVLSCLVNHTTVQIGNSDLNQ